MGYAVQRSILKSMVMYASIGIGAFSTLFIYPLQIELYGALQFILSIAGFFLPIATLGTLTLSNRYFPFFKDERSGHHGFFGLLFYLSTAGFLIFALVGFLTKDIVFRLLDSLNMDSKLIQAYGAEILIIIFSLVFLRLASMYLINFKRIVASSIVEAFLPKLILPILVLLVYFEFLEWSQGKWLYVISQLILAIILLIYVYWLGEFKLKVDWAFLRKMQPKEMAIFSMYSLLRNLGILLSNRVDTIMIATMIDLRTTGIYSIALFISNVMLIPRAAIFQIWTADIAQYSKEQNTSALANLYKKSARILFFLCGFVFFLIWFNIDDILTFSPKTELLIQGKYVVLYIGLAKLVDTLFGVNGAILTFSKYYKFNVVMAILLGILSIILNLKLIPLYGIDGAAIATLISLLVFNLCKAVYIKIRLQINPFSKNLFIILLLSLITFGILTITPHIKYRLLNLVVRSILVFVLFGLPIYSFNLIPEIRTLINSYRERIIWLK